MKNTFLHTGNAGDIISSIPAIRESYRRTGEKPTLYIVKDVDAVYYEGAVHPIKNEEGKNVMMNQKMCDMLIPLLKAQPFFEDVKVWDGNEIPYEDIMCDLSQIRETFVGLPNGSINRWYFYVYPDLACDLSKPWLEVPDSEKDLAKDKIIITRTERYHNNADYSFLKPYEDELIFSGTMREYNVFCMNYDLNIKKLTVDNFLTLAQAIKQSRFHITNQTMANQISTGIFHPSILELCSFAPNCIPIGENRYDFFAQAGLEYYFHKLRGSEAEYIDSLKKDIENKKTAIKTVLND